MRLPIVILTAPIFGFAGLTGAQAAQEDGAETAAEEDPSQRMRCETRRVTGSNVRRTRICMTVAEWERVATDGNRDVRREMVDEGSRDHMQRN